jgi:hypothetical protein
MHKMDFDMTGRRVCRGVRTRVVREGESDICLCLIIPVMTASAAARNIPVILIRIPARCMTRRIAVGQDGNLPEAHPQRWADTRAINAIGAGAMCSSVRDDAHRLMNSNGPPTCTPMVVAEVREGRAASDRTARKCRGK